MQDFEGECESHPWHLHDHSFWILARGGGDMTSERVNALKNVYYELEEDQGVTKIQNFFKHQKGMDGVKFFSKPLKRDTVTLHPTYGKQVKKHDNCGWVLLRFYANNAGIWPFHCHMSMHSMRGIYDIH